MQVHGSCFPTHAKEAVGFSRKALWTHFPVPAYNICGGSAQEPPSRPMAFHLASCQSMLLQCWLMQSLLVVHGCGNQIWIILKFIEVHYNSAAGMDDDDFVSAWSLCMTAVVTWWTDLNVPSSFKFIVDVSVCHRFGHRIPEGDVIHASVTWLFVLCRQCGHDSFHRGRPTAKKVAWISSLHWKEQNETAAPLRAWCESHGYDSSLDAHSLFVLGHGIQNDNQDGKFRSAFACRGHQDSIVCNIGLDAFCWCACLSKGV